MEALLFVPLLIGALFCALYYYVTRTFNYWKSRGVKGPKPVALFGNVMTKALRRQGISQMYKEFYDNFPNEKVVGIYRMTTPCLVIRDLDIIKHIMIKDFDMFVDRGIEFSKEGLGQNLFHSDGDTWRVLRNRFTPLFTSGKLKNMLYLLTEKGDKFVEYIEEICKKQPEQNVHTLIQKYTMSTIGACAFGLDIDTLHDKIDTLRKIDDVVLKSTVFEELDMMYPGILKILNASLFPRFIKEFFDDLVKQIITQRNGKPTNRNDFMDLILELRREGTIQGTKRNADDKQLVVDLTDDIIAAQAFVFYIAGYETSATTMAFLLFELAKNPDVQEKLIEEIDSIMEKYDGKITYEAMTEMKYLEKVFQETLRMYPLVDPLQRNAQADYNIPGTDIILKKGQTVLIPVLGIHSDPKIYPEPERFDPERFAPENSKDRHSCAFMSFGVGPRNCIGMRFAKYQSHVCIAKFLSKFRVEFSGNSKSYIEANPNRPIMGPKNGVPLNIRKR